MDILLFEFLPPIFILVATGVLAYYFFKLLYKMIEEVKHDKTITDVVLFILGSLVLSIMLILMVVLAIEATV
jgi:hypothetical protein